MSVIVFRAANHKMEHLSVSADTLDEATLKTGHGVYSVFRLYPRPDGLCTLRLERHLDRMRRSAQTLAQPFPHSDDELRAWLRIAVQQAGITVPRIRLTVPFDQPDEVIIALEPYSPPSPSAYQQGIAVGLVEGQRRRPHVKDSRFIEQRQRFHQQHSDVYEVLLVDDDGRILEGSGSNFYAIADGVLQTSDDGMLQGIARSILLDVAPDVLSVVFKPATIDALSGFDEALLTSSSRGVLPIVSIDGAAIGSGFPGPFTRRLTIAYNACVEAELEPL